MIASSAPDGEKADSYFNASFILGGQIRGTEPRLFMIYPEGNFIESSDDTPFFQIGETKYGKPIIVRAYDRAMSFAETAKLLLVSFDSTLKSNLSVGLPLDLLFYEKDSCKLGLKKRIGQDDPYYRTDLRRLVQRAEERLQEPAGFSGELISFVPAVGSLSRRRISRQCCKRRAST